MNELLKEIQARKRQSGLPARLHRTLAGEWSWSEEEERPAHSSDEEEEERPIVYLHEADSSGTDNEQVVGGAIKLEQLNDSWYELQAQIIGPPDSPYEGGRFLLEIKVPETYPFDPPKIRFMTKIWHPNVSSVTGAICLDILKDQWAAVLTLRTVLLSIQALLSAAEPDDPQDAVVAKQYKENQSLFQLTARHWSDVYASAGSHCPDCDAKVQQLADMGVDEHRARVALSICDWELERATEHLFS